MKRRILLFLFAAGLFVLGACALLRTQRDSVAHPVRLTMAIPSQLVSGAVHVGQAHNLFERHGVALATQTFKTGKQALDAMLAGQADLALVGDTPFVLAVLRGERIGVISTVYSSRKAMALVGWRARGVLPNSSLAGKRLGTVRGTNSQFFLDALLTAQGLDRHGVEVVELPADGLADALRTGRVDAATLWHPDLARMQAELGARATTLYGDDLFVFRFLLVGRRDVLDRQSEAVSRLVAAMAEATDLIHDRPDVAATVIGGSMGMRPDAFAGAFDASDYRLALDQSLLLSLSAQTRWARRHGLVSDAPADPDYLGLLDQRPLRAARPGAIRVIQ